MGTAMGVLHFTALLLVLFLLGLCVLAIAQEGL